ncbi:SPOR domain-containing protein [Sphingomonas sp. AR_OL41]|uniref:SPOR domain-containing protein n=1 Tax=Sphingomonas sp. AR_OL41 TaxID=3042729 RepID=UPI002480A23B|nr:SPOR domain-containing protein [Sphingomonas sp. AR_OL41]MDH7970823.1 SPOR domain-containing protein [Sphingomonas sp. AR_OL41]
MTATIIMLAALAAQATPARPSPGVSESPVARMPVSSLDGAPPPDLPQGAGPRGTSGEQRYDATGYASVAERDGDSTAIAVAGDGVAQGSFVEITALDSGKTIIALVSGHGSGEGIIDLSPAAARSLGVDRGPTAVRVRNVTPIPQDQVALRSGRAASPRIDAPQTLLVALRKRLPAAAPSRPIRRPLPPTRPTPQAGASYPVPADAALPEPVPVPPRRPGASYAPPRGQMAPAASGWYVQVAALSSLARAQALVGSLGGGRVVSSGGIHRVQIGPYGSVATATQARDDAARRGYAGARVVHD